MSPSKFTHRPAAGYIRMNEQELRKNIDQDLPRIYDAHASLNATAVKAPTFGGTFATAAGEVSVTGTKTGLATGLSNVTTAVASINNGAAATNFWVTCRPSPTIAGAIDIFVWQPTANNDNTPIAATTAVTVHWSVTGDAETTT